MGQTVPRMVLGCVGAVCAVAMMVAALFLLDASSQGMSATVRWACLAGSLACALLAHAVIAWAVLPMIHSHGRRRSGVAAGLAVLGSLSAAVSVGLLAAAQRLE